MPELPSPSFSYRDDPRVPVFDDSRALFVFDGVCVLCSGGAAFLSVRDVEPARRAFAVANPGHPA